LVTGTSKRISYAYEVYFGQQKQQNIGRKR